jgi:hypothetical protein
MKCYVQFGSYQLPQFSRSSSTAYHDFYCIGIIHWWTSGQESKLNCRNIVNQVWVKLKKIQVCKCFFLMCLFKHHNRMSCPKIQKKQFIFVCIASFTKMRFLFLLGVLYQPCVVMLPRPYMLIKLLHQNAARQSAAHLCVIRVGAG